MKIQVNIYKNSQDQHSYQCKKIDSDIKTDDNKIQMMSGLDNQIATATFRLHGIECHNYEKDASVNQKDSYLKTLEDQLNQNYSKTLVTMENLNSLANQIKNEFLRPVAATAPKQPSVATQGILAGKPQTIDEIMAFVRQERAKKEETKEVINKVAGLKK